MENVAIHLRQGYSGQDVKMLPVAVFNTNGKISQRGSASNKHRHIVGQSDFFSGSSDIAADEFVADFGILAVKKVVELS